MMDTNSRKVDDKDSRTAIEGDGDTMRRIEVITGAGRRRRWSEQAKTRIVEESFDAGASVSEVARRHDMSPSLLFYWRRQMTMPSTTEASEEPTFVPVKIEGAAPLPGSGEAPAIEIFIGDIRIRVTGRVDCDALRDVFAAAQAAR
jgi:transposase